MTNYNWTCFTSCRVDITPEQDAQLKQLILEFFTTNQGQPPISVQSMTGVGPDIQEAPQ